jgi:hypothetical protein
MTKHEQTLARDAAVRLAREIKWSNPPLIDAIVIVRVEDVRPPPLMLFDTEALRWVEAVSSRWGRRIVRLLYYWDAIETAARGPSTALTELIAKFAQPGEVLRARIRYAARESDQITGIY